MFNKLSVMILLSLTVQGETAKSLNIDEIIDRLDRLYRSKTAYMEMEMTVQTPHWKRTMRMESWAEGLKKTFITILSPRKDRGISTLRSDTEMWNFFPKINKVMKIPPSMMMGSWMGSDFTNDDLVKESSMMDDYTGRLLENSDQKNHYIELVPKKQTVTVWGKIVAVVDKETILPIKQIYYDEKNRLMRTLYFKDVKELGGKTIPCTMELVPENKEGHKTIVKHLQAEFDGKIDSNVFTLRNLQKKRH